jgi:hypothetical protein
VRLKTILMLQNLVRDGIVNLKFRIFGILNRLACPLFPVPCDLFPIAYGLFPVT